MAEDQTEAETPLRALAEQRGLWSGVAKSEGPFVGKAVPHSCARNDLYTHLGTDRRTDEHWRGAGTKWSTLRRTMPSLSMPKL